MKLLLIAGNPDTSSTLSLDREITGLQRRFLDVSPEACEFIPLPDLRAEELPLNLRLIEPDILHVTAHGETSHLVWATADGSTVEITAERLRAFLSPNKSPRLIYFSGCKSAEIAKAVLAPVAMAVGTAVTIGNGPARAAAVAFYESVLSGSSIGLAFAAANAMAGTLGNVALELHSMDGVDPAREVLRPRPRVIARFPRVQEAQDRTFPVAVGVERCPKSTTQLVAFLDGEPAPCVSTRPEWIGDTAWLRAELRVMADRRLIVVGLIAGGARFIAESQLCDVLKGADQENVRWAIRKLKERSA